MNESKCFGVVAPGLEEVALEEARSLGFTKPTLVDGGFEFDGGLYEGIRACLMLRCVTTIRLRIARFRAADRGGLNRGLSAIQWNRWYSTGDPVEVSSSARKSKLNHTGMLADAVSRASGRKLIKGGGGIHLRIFRDEAELSFDLAGERLHLRGWRLEGGAAPLRETLAAGIIRLSDWRTDEPFLDPMCGSGTLPIEAALGALGVPTGFLPYSDAGQGGSVQWKQGRGFAFESIPSLDRSRCLKIKEKALRGIREPSSAMIFGRDRSGGAVGSSRRNAKRAGVAGLISLERCDVSDLAKVTGVQSGVLVVNPPYGARMGGGDSALKALYSALAKSISKNYSTWRSFVLAPDMRLVESVFNVRDAKAVTLKNGGLRVYLCRVS